MSSEASEGFGPLTPLTERICTGSAAAMSHSRHHEETIEVPDVFVAAHLSRHCVIVIDVVLR